ncbi:MAG: zinc ribbon domain-containing protein [Treponema sp.]|nr:zinc ribbon domain-containing protein [Treponema sp.]
MFCSGCGKEIQEGSKFCSGCGKAADGSAPNAVSPASDTSKILKEGEFRRFEKPMEAANKKNDGKLTLFCNRLEYRGKDNDDIKIDDISEVGAAYIMGNVGEKCLKITDKAGKVYKYYRVSKFYERMASFSAVKGGTTTLDDINEELERWRAAIDKVRGRL